MYYSIDEYEYEYDPEGSEAAWFAWLDEQAAIWEANHEEE